MNITITQQTILLLFLIHSAIIGAYGQAPGVPDPTMDAMERKLEMYRHESLLRRIAENETSLSHFTTDGCSGGLSTGWEKLSDRFPRFAERHGKQAPWQTCCVAHDREYHTGSAGAVTAGKSFDRRKAADYGLKACIVEVGLQRSAVLQEEYGLSEAEVRVLYEAISQLMYRAVRLGGIPCTNKPWRWGYGWPQCR